MCGSYYPVVGSSKVRIRPLRNPHRRFCTEGEHNARLRSGLIVYECLRNCRFCRWCVFFDGILYNCGWEGLYCCQKMKRHRK